MKKSFTLLELLIVIAILAILAGLLLPALGAARNKARSIECLGNLRQNALAMQMYSMDFGGHVVTYTKDSSKATIPWTMILFEGKYVPGTSYLKTKTFLCPALPPEGFVDPYRTYGSLRFNDMWEADYFENEKGWGNFCLRDVAMATQEFYYLPQKLKKPSQALHFADTLYISPGNLGDGVGFYYMPLMVIANATLSVHHDRKANIAFFDGHAAAVSDAALQAEGVTALVVNGRKLE